MRKCLSGLTGNTRFMYACGSCDYCFSLLLVVAAAQFTLFSLSPLRHIAEIPIDLQEWYPGSGCVCRG